MANKLIFEKIEKLEKMTDKEIRNALGRYSAIIYSMKRINEDKFLIAEYEPNNVELEFYIYDSKAKCKSNKFSTANKFDNGKCIMGKGITEIFGEEIWDSKWEGERGYQILKALIVEMEYIMDKYGEEILKDINI